MNTNEMNTNNQTRWSDSYFYNMKNYDAIEIGALDGSTTKYLSKFFKRVFVIDPWDGRQQGEPHKYDIFLNNTKDLNVYHCRTGSETPLAKDFLNKAAENANFGFAYIDGMHTRDAVINDFNLCKNLIQPNGYIFIDDCFDNSVNDGVNFIKQENISSYVEREPSFVSLSVWNDGYNHVRIFQKI